MARHLGRRPGFVLAGFLLGLLVMLVGIYVYYQSTTGYQQLETVAHTVNLPPEALRLEALEGDSVARVALDDVALLGAHGDTVAYAPTMHFRLLLSSLSANGPVELTQVVLDRPYLNLVQRPDGSYNLAEVVAMTAGGKRVNPPEQGKSYGFLLRDVSIRNGRLRLVTPWQPDSAMGVPNTAAVRLASVGGRTVQVRSATDLDARLPVLRFGGDEGWRVQVASLTAQLHGPDVRIRALSGFAAAGANGAIRFAVTTLRAGNSVVDGGGTVDFGGKTPRFDVHLRAHPVQLADLRWAVPSLPAAGRLTGSFALQSRAGGRMAVRGSGVDLTAYGSHVAGHFAALVGGGVPASFYDTELSLKPFLLSTLDSLGYGDKVPYSGTVTGTLASTADSTAAQGLVVNLLARVTPRGESAPVSVVSLRGPVSVGGKGAMVRFEGLRVALQPLYLAALRPLAPPTADERLRGVVHGSVTVFGTPEKVRLTDGELTYEVDDAPPTRLTGLSLTATLQPELHFDLQMRADPLALGTLSALFPAFPFRTARFSGPVHIAGTMEQLTVDADLAGAAGGISAHGTISPGSKPLAFDLSGELRSFNAESVVSAAVPVQGPVTGKYHVAGNLNDLRFNVALAQDTGSFALHGTVVRPGGGAPRFSVAGTVTNFNLGMLIGRPRLLPGRVSGPISVTGGGNEPYQFNVALTGNGSRLQLSGYFAGGATPTFQLNGQVNGLNLAQLPLPVPMPQSSINGYISLTGSGKTLATLTASLRLDATGSVIGGLPVEAMRANLSVANGVLAVDTLTARFAGNVLTAEGMFGLTHPAPRPLDFRVVAPDLARLAALTAETPALEANITGSFTLQGTLSGWLKAPVLNARFRGQQLRYQDYSARQLSFDANATLPVGNQQLRGTVSLIGEDVSVAGTSLDSVRVALRGGVDQVAVRISASRDQASDLSLAGLVELEGTTPRGLLLDSLAVHLGAARWKLAQRAEIRWGGVHGVAISNLDLRRMDGGPGSILVNGTVPPSGTAGLKVTVRDFDLALVERALPSHPALAGLVNFDALLTGPVTNPHLSLQLSGNGLQYAGVTTDSLRLSAHYDQGALTGNATAWSSGLRIATLEATVPMKLQVGGGIPSVDLLRTEPIRAKIVADSIPLGLLTGPLQVVQNGAGAIAAQVTVAGSIDQPSLNGWATIRNGAVSIPMLGVTYQRISGRVEMQDQVLRIDTLTAWNGGQAVVDGTVRFPDLTHPELFLTATFNSFHAVDDPDLADLTLSGRVALSGSYPQPTLTGAVTLQQGTIHIPTTVGNRVAVDITAMDIGEIGPDTLSNAAVGPGPLAAVKLQDLNVTVNEGVWIESEQFRVQIRGLLRGYGTVGDPRIFGTLEAVRGTYTLSIGPLVRDFDVVSGSVRFTGGSELNPDLDITAAHEVRVVGGASSGSSTLTVLVHLTGTLDFPHVALTSDTRPPLPESELLNYLIFGRPSFQTAATSGGANPAQQLLVQQLLIQEFLGGLLVQEVGHASTLCDYLQVRGRPELLTTNPFSQTSVECGRQIAPDVFATLEAQVAPLLTGGTPHFGLSLEWQINNDLSARLAREPVRLGLPFQFGNIEVPYQWTTELKGGWEFAKPREQPPIQPKTEGEPQLPGTVAPPPPLDTTRVDSIRPDTLRADSARADTTRASENGLSLRVLLRQMDARALPGDRHGEIPDELLVGSDGVAGEDPPAPLGYVEDHLARAGRGVHHLRVAARLGVLQGDGIERLEGPGGPRPLGPTERVGARPHGTPKPGEPGEGAVRALLDLPSRPV